ncbi:flagellar biosynthesis protein FlhB [bacterium]|nr:flagellar biosynthesis protein FlhB [bacterium]
MADNEDKTEYQSQKKLEQSREKGELPRSQELGTFVVFTVFLIYFSSTGTLWFESIGALISEMLRFDQYLGLNRENLVDFLTLPVIHIAKLVAPLLLVILVVSPLVSLCQTGFNIARDKLAPDWSRLDPVAGFQRIFSLRQVIEGLKSTIKVGLFGWLAWTAVASRLDRIIAIGTLDLRDQINLLMDVSLAIGIRIAILMAVLAVADLGYQWWEFIKRMRMSHQEMKEEAKERDGNPLIKQRQRSLAMQAARQRMMAEVPKASVVVMNPTHFAVALRYDSAKAPAPIVVAKGQDEIALRIKKLALDSGVPVVENKPLARALHRKSKVGKMIPNEFFRAVAEVLAFVYMLKRKGKKSNGVMKQPASMMRHQVAARA